MKKQLIIATVVATMTSVSQAGISITGDSFFSYSNNAIANGAVKIKANNDNQRLRLKVVGTKGDTKVTAVIRNGSQTRVDWDPKTTDGERGLHIDSLYVTTKTGRINIKAGDYWSTTGLGARFKGSANKNALSLSTKFGPIKVGVSTQDGSNSGAGSTDVSVSGKFKGVTGGMTVNPNDYVDLSAKGAFKGISGAFEYYLDQTKDANKKKNKENTILVHVNGKFKKVKWDMAYIGNKQKGKTALYGGNSKLAPLGSMLIGKAARGGTATAVANVGQFTSIVGVAVSAKLAGNTIKGIFTMNKMPAVTTTIATVSSTTKEEKLKGVELIVSRPLGGAKLTANFGILSGATDANKGLNNSNKGIRLDVKF